MTAKGLGWVGKVGISENPAEKFGARWLLESLLDVYRYGAVQEWTRQLGVKRISKFHPGEPTDITDPIKDDSSIVVYIANAHGTFDQAYLRTKKDGQEVWITAADVESALAAREEPGPRKMKFAFLIHSEAMNEYENETPGPPEVHKNWSSVLRNKEMTGTAIIGVRWRMDVGQWMTWQNSWISAFFASVRVGKTFKQAFDYANFVCPLRDKDNNNQLKLVFWGDETMSKKDLT